MNSAIKSFKVLSFFFLFDKISWNIGVSLTCARVGGVEGQGWVSAEAVATSLAPAPEGVVPALVTNAPGGSTGGEPHSL